MIFCTNTTYAKVWEITQPTDENGNPRKYLELKLSTSEKQEDGTYKNSSWYARVVGHGYNSLKNLKEKDRIIITKAKFTNEYYKKEGEETGKSYFKFVILEAKIDDGNAPSSDQQQTQPAPQEPAPTNNKAEDDCPW